MEKSGGKASQSEKEVDDPVEEEEGQETMDTEAAGVSASDGGGVVAEEKVKMQACSVCLEQRLASWSGIALPCSPSVPSHIVSGYHDVFTVLHSLTKSKDRVVCTMDQVCHVCV